MSSLYALILSATLTACIVSTAGAAKVYVNCSDQTANFSPDNTYCEADGMKDVGQKLTDKLAARGFEVKYSNGDTMGNSVAAANAWPADIFISCHSNASAGPGWGKAHGTNTLYYLPRNGSPANPISMELARRCDDKVVEKMTTYGRGHDFGCVADLPFLTYNLYVLRRTTMPGTLVEGLFHDNEEDVAVLKTDEGRDAYAQGVYEAICDHFGWSYYPDAPILDPVGPVANDSDGLLAIVARGEKGNVQCLRQIGINCAWAGVWLDLKGSSAGEPAIGRNAQGRLQVFVRGADGRIRHKVQASVGSDRWNGWYDLGGNAASDPVVGGSPDGRLVVFAIGADRHLRYRYQKSVTSGIQWSEWADLGGGFVGRPGVLREHVVVRTRDNHLKAMAVGDPSWHNIDISAASNPLIAADSVFCLGAGGQVLFASEDRDWHDLGGAFVGNPAVSLSTDGRFEVFAIDSQGAVSHNSQGSDAKWSGWQTLGGSFTGDPMVARNKDGRIEVFARDKDGHIQFRVQREPARSGIWDGWYPLGEKPSGQLPATSEPPAQ